MDVKRGTNTEDAFVDVAAAVGLLAQMVRELGKGNAAGNMGAIEFLAVKVNEGLESVAAAIDHLADAVRQSGDAIGDRQAEPE